jgi:hypothetical protein
MSKLIVNSLISTKRFQKILAKCKYYSIDGILWLKTHLVFIVFIVIPLPVKREPKLDGWNVFLGHVALKTDADSNASMTMSGYVKIVSIDAIPPMKYVLGHHQTSNYLEKRRSIALCYDRR